MYLTIIKFYLALKVIASLKPTVESSTKEKKFYEDWKYSNNCCLMIMENNMEDSIYESIHKTRSSLMLLARNIQSSQKLRKMSYLIIIG